MSGRTVGHVVVEVVDLEEGGVVVEWLGSAVSHDQAVDTLAALAATPAYAGADLRVARIVIEDDE